MSQSVVLFCVRVWLWDWEEQVSTMSAQQECFTHQLSVSCFLLWLCVLAFIVELLRLAALKVHLTPWHVVLCPAWCQEKLEQQHCEDYSLWSEELLRGREKAEPNWYQIHRPCQSFQSSVCWSKPERHFLQHTPRDSMDLNLIVKLWAERVSRLFCGPQLPYLWKASEEIAALREEQPRKSVKLLMARSLFSFACWSILSIFVRTLSFESSSWRTWSDRSVSGIRTWCHNCCRWKHLGPRLSSDVRLCVKSLVW